MRFKNKSNLPEVDFERQLSDIQESMINVPRDVLADVLQEHNFDVDRLRHLLQTAEKKSNQASQASMMRADDMTQPVITQDMLDTLAAMQLVSYKLKSQHLAQERQSKKYSLSVVFVMVLGGLLAMYLDSPVASALFNGVTLVALVGYFANSTLEKKKKKKPK